MAVVVKRSDNSVSYKQEMQSVVYVFTFYANKELT